MSGFSSKEIAENIDHIRSMYGTYANQYKDLNIFDVELFNGRYLKALQEKIDITIFIKAEISVLEDLKKRAEELKHEKIKKEEINEATFMSKVDEMLEKFSDAIEKYPAVSIHENSNDEIDRLYGGFIELYGCFIVVKSVLLGLKDYSVETSLKDLDNKMQSFVYSGVGGKPPQIFVDYYNDLITHKESARAEQYILKEAGFFLHNFVSKFEVMSSFISRIPSDVSVVIPQEVKLNAPRVYKSLSQKTQSEVFFATKLYAEAMINDFRLQYFKNSES